MGAGIIGDRAPLVTVVSASISNDSKKVIQSRISTSSNAIPRGENGNSISTEIDVSIQKHVAKKLNAGDSFIPRWGRITKALMIAAVVGYMLYKDQALNVFMLCGRIIHLLFFPIISLRDVDAPLNKPTTVEYNLQTHALVGILSYTIALLLLWLSTSNPLTLWFATFGRTQPYMALSVAAGFENNDKLFTLCFCRPFDFSSKKTTDRVYQELSLPVCLLSLLVLQNINDLVGYNQYITVVVTALIAYRMSILADDYQQARATKSETYPDEMVFTQGATRELDAITTNPGGHENVWRIYGNEYDATAFVKHHPGGVESIMLGANREDCTAVFQSYHAFSIRKAKAVLEKYRISPKTSPEDDVKLQGSYPVGHHNDLFYEELVKRVTKKLLDNGIDPIKDRYASWGRYFVYAIVMSCIIVSGYYHLTGSLIGSFLFGVSGAYMGANIGHDGGHFAISSVPLVNDLCVWGIGLICNPIIWQHQHTYAHHSYTNQESHDPDLHHFHILMRYSPLHKLLPWYKMQIHGLYILWAFGWTDFGTCYWNSWRFVFERSLHGVVEWTDRKRFFRTAQLLLHLFGYSAMCYIVPFWFHERGWTALLAGVIHMSTAGFIFGIFSQVGHISELALARDPVKTREQRSEIAKDSWGAEQVETTNDFCPQSNAWFIIGLLLSVQIEHHLFPSLNHRHLQLIQPTVEECCKEYNVVYKKYESWADAMCDTIKYLQSLSKDESSKDITNKKNE